MCLGLIYIIQNKNTSLRAFIEAVFNCVCLGWWFFQLIRRFRGCVCLWRSSQGLQLLFGVLSACWVVCCRMIRHDINLHCSGVFYMFGGLLLFLLFSCCAFWCLLRLPRVVLVVPLWIHYKHLLSVSGVCRLVVHFMYIICNLCA